MGYQGQQNAERTAAAQAEGQRQKQFAGGEAAPDHGLAIEAVRETGTLAAFTTQYGWADVGADPMNLPRVRIQGTGSLDTFIAAIQ